jgi:lipopolysaccharide export system ATP-binding protein
VAPRRTLVLEGLAKNYGAKKAVREVTFSMESGEIVGLLGPNGAGKTTVFYMVVGFIRPTSGRIWLDGHDVTGLPMYRRARLGISYLPQEPSVFRKLSVGERRRTEIARSLAVEPKFLLLDEPFAGIDPITVSELKRIVQGLSAKGIGVLLTDHNVRDALQITHRSHIINLGEILVSGTREELLVNQLARQIYLGHEFEG